MKCIEIKQKESQEITNTIICQIITANKYQI